MNNSIILALVVVLTIVTVLLFLQGPEVFESQTIKKSPSKLFLDELIVGEMGTIKNTPSVDDDWNP